MRVGLALSRQQLRHAPAPRLLTPPRILQAAAAARIVGKPGILKAAENGDVALVRDHIVADPACVHLKDQWEYDPSNMQYFFENECDISVYFQSSNPFS